MAGLVTLLREETDGNISGGWEEGGEQTNKQTNYPQKTKPRTNIALAPTLHGRDAAKGVKGDFCCCCFEISTLSPSHPLEIPKAKQHIPRVGLSSA